jgi:hypothetical protein
MIRYGWTLVVEEIGQTQPESADYDGGYSPIMYKTREDARRAQRVYKQVFKKNVKVLRAYFITGEK